jgi:uncharacterized protein (TIGR02466 family)
MFSHTTIELAFPSFIWIYDVAPAVHEPMNRRLAETLQRLTVPLPRVPPGRNWQTEQTLHEVPEFADLVGLVLDATDDVLEKMEAEHEGFCLTACWANINPKGAFHVPHHHPNNFLSGVYYLKTQEGADSITFHDPRPSVETIAPRYRNTNRFNAMEHAIPVRTGRIVIFPSWLVHSVRGNMSDEIRISISFNIQFSDFEKVIARPRWKGLPLNRDALKGG